jgi:hypothetical protein
MEDRKFVIKRAIEETANDDGIVTADAVVDAARNKNSPLHDEFEWDDSVAGHQYRLDQARSLIREVRYISLDVTESVIKTVAYVRDPRLPPKTQGYVSLQSVSRNKKLAADVVMAELNRCEAALNRANDVATILGIDVKIDEIRASVHELKSEVADNALPPKRGRPSAGKGRRGRPENRPSA